MLIIMTSTPSPYEKEAEKMCKSIDYTCMYVYTVGNSFYLIETPSTWLAWKAMLDSDGFIKAGWIHDMRLYQFITGDC